MESTERLQRRIDTLCELRNIVKTMKALSATSILQYEQAVLALSDYYRTVELGLHVVLKDTARLPPPVDREGKARHLGAIVFGSDQGLCGRFNEDILGYARQRMAASPASEGTHRLLAVGSRIAIKMEQAGLHPESDFLLPGSAARITATVQQVLLKIDEWRDDSDIGYVYLFYNCNLGNGYKPTGIELLPVNLHRFRRLESAPWPSRRLPTFTMEPKRLLGELLRQYFFVSIFRACAESQAAEHASRLAAMQSAGKNLDETLEEVSTLARRLRQEAITTELLDVVSGFEAVMSLDHE